MAEDIFSGRKDADGRSIKKRPGPDWEVRFQWTDPMDRDPEYEIEVMLVFGAQTEAEALQDAISSLDDPSSYIILDVTRVDDPLSLGEVPA